MKEERMAVTHLGEHPGDYLHAVVPPVFLNSLHVFDCYEDYKNREETGAFVYGRDANPTVEILEQKVAALEEGAAGIAFASGMAAASAAILATCRAGSHIICMRDVYQPVKTILHQYLIPNLGMSVSFWDGLELDRLEGMITEKTSLILLESPATFVFTVTDLEGVAEIARKHGVKTYIDNTYCTPLYQKPLAMGIDIVMHTMSKYIGGHSDIIGGILVVRDEKLGRMIRHTIRELFGGILGPMEAWLAIRGLRTLPLRLEKHQETALKVAQFLEGQEQVRKVFYTGLKSHPQAALIEKQQKGHTGLLSFVLKGDQRRAARVIDRLKVFQIGCSWGGFESLALCPLMEYTGEQLQFLGLDESFRGLTRLYCGLEGADVLIEDLKQALAEE